MKGKTILVTGGCGFIGFNLIKSLKDENIVHSIDNYSSGLKERELDNVKYYRLDTKDIFEIENICSPDIIYHLGEYSRVENSINYPTTVFDSNILGTYKVLQFAEKKMAKVIYAGSSTKFGDNGRNKHETPYAFTKSVNTEIVKNYCEWNKINYAITYFYNVYGEGENETGDYATVIGIFKNKYLNNQPIPVVRPGNQTRNFTYIQDIVSGLILVGDKGYGDDYGIGSESKFSILEIAKLFSSNIVYLPPRIGNRMDANLITSKTTKLGWKAKGDLTNYIKEIKARFES